MSKKAYARQIPPEYQESPLFLGDWPEDVIVTGNRDYNSHTSPAYNTIVENIEDVPGELESVGDEYSWYKTATAYFNDVFTPTHKAGYNTREIAHWKRIAKEWQTAESYEENTLVCQALYLMTGKQYAFATIRGCCQGDWQECFYPVEFGPDYVKYFETEYFNTGTEWVIHDEETAPESPEDINGYTMYCYTYHPADEIAQETGAKPKDVVLYQFEGYNQIARYALMEG